MCDDPQRHTNNVDNNMCSNLFKTFFGEVSLKNKIKNATFLNRSLFAFTYCILPSSGSIVASAVSNTRSACGLQLASLFGAANDCSNVNIYLKKSTDLIAK